jgi:hypothetical protein
MMMTTTTTTMTLFATVVGLKIDASVSFVPILRFALIRFDSIRFTGRVVSSHTKLATINLNTNKTPPLFLSERSILFLRLCDRP